MKFKDLNLAENLLRAIEEKGYTDPTPIQLQAIPPALEGRDLQGCAQTGTGKTAAFTLPILQLLAAEPAPKGRRPIRALVITPTRELAIQIDECCRDYGRYTSLRHTVIFGGVNQRPQVEALQRGVDLLVATPGRLLDLIGQGYVTLDHVRFFVLDEADRMLDMGFIHDIRRILPLLPERRQTLFFSATMPSDIAALAAKILRDPVLVTVTPPASVVETISQKVYFAEKAEKSQLLIDLLNGTDVGQVLVFTRTKHGADKLARILNKAGIESRAIHGNKSQNARVKAMNDFKSGACRLLIATDIAARGIDISQLPLVINYELPEVPETYVHRIGRTGRAGYEGSAWSFCSQDEYDYLKEIQKLTGLTLPTEGPVPEFAARAAAPARATAAKPAARSAARTAGRGRSAKPAEEDATAAQAAEPTLSGGKKPRRGTRTAPGVPVAEAGSSARKPAEGRTGRQSEAAGCSDRERRTDGCRTDSRSGSEAGQAPKSAARTASGNRRQGASAETTAAQNASGRRHEASSETTPAKSASGRRQGATSAAGSDPSTPAASRRRKRRPAEAAQAPSPAPTAKPVKQSTARTAARPAAEAAEPAPRKSWWRRWV